MECDLVILLEEVKILIHVRYMYTCFRVDEPQCVTIHMKAIEQYFHVVLFIMLYKVVVTFNSVDETLVCDHSNERY